MFHWWWSPTNYCMTDSQKPSGDSPLSNMVRNMSGEPLESAGVSCANCSRSLSVSILLFRRAVEVEHLWTYLLAFSLLRNMTWLTSLHTVLTTSLSILIKYNNISFYLCSTVWFKFICLLKHCHKKLNLACLLRKICITNPLRKILILYSTRHNKMVKQVG